MGARRRYVVRREFESGPVGIAEIGIELAADADAVIVKAFADLTAPILVTPASVMSSIKPRVGSRWTTNVAAERFNARLRGFDAEQELIRLTIDRPAPRRIITDRESTGVG